MNLWNYESLLFFYITPLRWNSLLLKYDARTQPYRPSSQASYGRVKIVKTGAEDVILISQLYLPHVHWTLLITGQLNRRRGYCSTIRMQGGWWSTIIIYSPVALYWTITPNTHGNINRTVLVCCVVAKEKFLRASSTVSQSYLTPVHLAINKTVLLSLGWDIFAANYRYASWSWHDG